MLSRDDIIKALVDGHLKIFPFDKKNLTGLGYNLSTTDFAFSITYGILLTIHQVTTTTGVQRFVTIPSNDTVLFFSKEYIEIDRTLAGTFSSKVARVSQGLGHISTTLDPTWKGQLLISVNNPTSKPIDFDLSSSGNIMTLLLHKLDTPVSGDNIHDNNKGRCELLIAHFEKPFSNLKYREQHLQLQNFVQNELAESLNGNDNFLNLNARQDEFAQRIQQLMALRERLTLDRLLIQEERYELGQNGEYLCIKDLNEYQLLARCTLFKYMPNHINVLLPGEERQTHYKKNNLCTALPCINACLNIIDYELKTIDHIRRIRWQNETVQGFASEESDLVRLRREDEAQKKRTEKRMQSMRFVGSLVVVLFIIIIFVLIISRFIPDSNEMVMIWTPLMCVILTGIINKFWRN